jgi:hypothetical protein
MKENISPLREPTSLLRTKHDPHVDPANVLYWAVMNGLEPEIPQERHIQDGMFTQIPDVTSDILRLYRPYFTASDKSKE